VYNVILHVYNTTTKFKDGMTIISSVIANSVVELRGLATLTLNGITNCYGHLMY